MIKRLAIIFTAAVLIATQGNAADNRFRLATTTSTENSGLLDAIIPLFTAKTGITIDVVAVGTGQALEMGRRGDAAALLTHDRIGEDMFIANGYGTDRRDVMYNDFVIIGPGNDPAGLDTFNTVEDALARIHSSEAVFISRGDDSGTHRKEIRLWASINLEPDNFGAWYREVGAGMGQTLLTTTEMDGYTLSDRATWTKFNRKSGFKIVVENDPPLFNPYSSMRVVNTALSEDEADHARQWHEWLTGPQGQSAIINYRVEGQQLFFVEDANSNG